MSQAPRPGTTYNCAPFPGKPLKENRNVTDQWLSEYGVTIGVGGLILFMVFIVWDLARKSNAGVFGTLILYLALAMGILGFVIKTAITYLLESGMD